MDGDGQARVSNAAFREANAIMDGLTRNVERFNSNPKPFSIPGRQLYKLKKISKR